MSGSLIGIKARTHHMSPTVCALPQCKRVVWVAQPMEVACSGWFQQSLHHGLYRTQLTAEFACSWEDSKTVWGAGQSARVLCWHVEKMQETGVHTVPWCWCVNSKRHTSHWRLLGYGCTRLTSQQAKIDAQVPI